MEERENLSWSDVVKISESFPWEPSFNKLVVTLNREVIEGTLDLSDSTMDEEQFIVSVGPHVRNYFPGDTILLDLEKMMITRPNPNNQDENLGQIKFDPIYDDEDNMFAIIEDRFVKARKKTNQPLQSNE